MIFENTWACDPIETLTAQHPPSIKGTAPISRSFFRASKKRLTETGKRAWKAYRTQGKPRTKIGIVIVK